jgi:hypothetical protein
MDEEKPFEITRVNDESNDESNSNLKTLKPTYNKAKSAYVTFGGSGVKKVKLRKYVQDKSKLLSRINGFTHSHNRNNLIEAFDILGLDGINQLMKEEVDMALLKQKRFLKQQELKQKENEGHQEVTE